jgi:hypothetical protein
MNPSEPLTIDTILTFLLLDENNKCEIIEGTEKVIV